VPTSNLTFRLFVQPQKRARPLMMRTVAGHQPVQTRFVERDRVIETLATSGSDESPHESILPGRSRGGEHFFDPHRFRRGPEAVERLIVIVSEAPPPMGTVRAVAGPFTQPSDVR
jgi:hypothetical protein